MATALLPRDQADGGAVSARLLDEYGAAAFLAISVQSIRRMRQRRGRGETGPDAGPPFIRLFSCVRYDRADLHRWVAELPRDAGAEHARRGRPRKVAGGGA